jgi:hypothetical protein
MNATRLQNLATVAVWVCLGALLTTDMRAAPLVGTHFFYWYDAPYNNVNQSQMAFHPPGISAPYNGTYYSSLSQGWYEWQLRDMASAGIDHVYPVSWGENYQSAYFRQSVLYRLRDAINAIGSPLKVGMYDDTQSEAAEWNADNGRGYINSTTDPNLQLSLNPAVALPYFYDRKIKPFFQIFPKTMWATHNGTLPVGAGGTGRPLILTFIHRYYKDTQYADDLWAQVKSRFQADFGVEPFIVLSWDWFHEFNNPDLWNVADAETVFGAACSAGIQTYNEPKGYVVANLGAGCDTRLLGRPDYQTRWSDRDGRDDKLEDQWLRDNWRQIPTTANLVVLESWNELWEGTSLSFCTDFPKKTGGALPADYYIKKTRKLVDELKNRPPSNTTLLNGGFESFDSALVSDWMPFQIAGRPSYVDETVAKHGGSHAQRWWTDWETHHAGVYQRVAATAGANYTFSAWTWRSDMWNNGNINEETWVGIDPYGGYDANSANVVWSPSQYSYQAWTLQSVSATAQASALTVFVRSRANWAGVGMKAVVDDATLSAPKVTVAEDFNALPAWSSSFDATWGGAAAWSVVAGGQSGNCLQASRSNTGSSVKAKVYNITANANYTISIWIRCPSSASSYWAECAYKLGNFSAQDFDQNAASWTLVKKFTNTGPNGNGDVWTHYSLTFNSGGNTQISVGYKLGASSGNGPVVKWDTLRIN